MFVDRASEELLRTRDVAGGPVGLRGENKKLAGRRSNLQPFVDARPRGGEAALGYVETDLPRQRWQRRCVEGERAIECGASRADVALCRRKYSPLNMHVGKLGMRGLERHEVLFGARELLCREQRSYERKPRHRAVWLVARCSFCGTKCRVRSARSDLQPRQLHLCRHRTWVQPQHIVEGFLGACDIAPMASSNERYYGPLDEGDAAKADLKLLDGEELALVKLAQLAADIPEVRTLDINPLLVDGKGILTILAGTGVKGDAGDNGPARQAMVNGPHSLAVGKDGLVYLADTWNNRIRTIDPKTGTVKAFAGLPGKKG